MSRTQAERSTFMRSPGVINHTENLICGVWFMKWLKTFGSALMDSDWTWIDSCCFRQACSQREGRLCVKPYLDVLFQRACEKRHAERGILLTFMSSLHLLDGPHWSASGLDPHAFCLMVCLFVCFKVHSVTTQWFCTPFPSQTRTNKWWHAANSCLCRGFETAHLQVSFSR